MDANDADALDATQFDPMPEIAARVRLKDQPNSEVRAVGQHRRQITDALQKSDTKVANPRARKRGRGEDRRPCDEWS